MEEDEMALLDYRSPKGKLIKVVEQKIKKPEIDDSLGKILDQFSKLNNDQTTYLENGIFHMNFAEDALLLQSCGQLYAKRVDKLWDELLQFHTRMVKYDDSTAKYCTDSDKREARNQEIAKLEERLNRGKRKKIVLAKPEDLAPPQNGLYLFDIEQEDVSDLFDNLNFPFPEDEVPCEEESVVPFDFDFDAIDEWREIREIDEEEKRRSNYSTFVAHYYRLRYRFKHYSTPTSNDIIYDWSDPEEFNTREGRLISCHHIRHLFHDNDRCLLPDEHFTIARLRFAYILKKKWFMKNKIDPTAPYETYKAAWEKYQQEFFANEKRKIQNMPQRTSDELLRFYKALARKEELAREKVEKLKAMGVKDLPVVTFDNVIVAPTIEGYTGIFDPYIPEEFDDNPPEQTGQEFDISNEAAAGAVGDGDHEAELSSLLQDPPDHDSQAAAEKSRSDSGYFDGGFADDDSDHEETRENAANGSETPFEFDKDTNKNAEEGAAQCTAENGGENPTLGSQEIPSVTENPETSVGVELSSSETHEILSPTENTECSIETELSTRPSPANENNSLSEVGASSPQFESVSVDRMAMNSAIKEFVKQASSEPDIVYQALENSHFEQTDYLTTIVYDKPSSYVDVPFQGDLSFFLGYFDKDNEMEAEKAAVMKHKKRKLELVIDEPLPKRKKLSRIQLEKLKRSVIMPVKQQKWEAFFSLNYQTESGEGKIVRVDYESESEEEPEDEDINDNEDKVDFEDDTVCADLNVSGYHSEYEANEHNSDPCRSESETLPLTQDSGVEVNTSINEGNLDLSVESLNQETSTLNQNKPAEVTAGFGSLKSAEIFPDLKNSMFDEILPDEPAIVEEQRKLTADEEETEMAKARVEEWSTHITSKLKKLDEKDFDIHEYGTKIINNMNINETKPFHEFVRGKSSAEVVRYFISSLQLANTLNVEICGAKKGELSNDTFQLKLLSKERYHEHFQEYQAPSEETLPDKLEKIKEIRLQSKKKQNSKRKAPDRTAQHFDSSKSSGKKPSNSQASKKIKILNYSILKGRNQDCVQQSSSTDEDFGSAQPSTSLQADYMDQQDVLDSVIGEMQGPPRTNVDSGFLPSCDEEFLEQFEQLQHLSDTYLRSTPVKP